MSRSPIWHVLPRSSIHAVHRLSLRRTAHHPTPCTVAPIATTGQSFTTRSPFTHQFFHAHGSSILQVVATHCMYGPPADKQKVMLVVPPLPSCRLKQTDNP